MRDKTPKFYGIAYFMLIPLFALIYYFLPAGDFKSSDLSIDNFLTCIYFSTVTITTLGYGDISAISEWSQVLVGLETLLGIVLIGLFLNALSHQKSKEISEEEKENAEKERFKKDCEKILRHNKLIEQAIELYMDYAYKVTTPRSMQATVKQLNRQFTLNDLQDLYSPSLYMTDDFSEPVIKYFYTHQSNLESSIKELILSVNFLKWKELEVECIKLLKSFKDYDCSASILSSPNIVLYGRESINQIEYISNMIKESDSDPNAELGRSNRIHPYIMLYRLIKITLAFTDFYFAKIKEVEDEI